MKVIFMGTPEFSVGTLAAIVEAGHEVVLAVTQPDKPKGRGKEMQYTPVKEFALEHGNPVYQPERIRRPECLEELQKYEADVIDKKTDALPGTIVEVTKQAFFVQTGDGLLRINSLQIPGKKRMETDAFLRGYQVEEGTLLG